MTDRLDRFYFSPSAWKPSMAPVDIEQERACACGATFRTRSRIRIYCPACKAAATKRANQKAMRKAKEKRKLNGK